MNSKEARAYAHASSAYSQTQPRRRGPLLIFGLGAFIFFTVFFSTSSVQEVRQVAHEATEHAKGHIPTVPNFPGLHNPFAPTVHNPPAPQKNSSSGDASWYDHYKWLNPFSSTTTFDERSVLPPLKERVPIYAYYDPEAEKNSDIKEQESKLIKIWRRAWWAQGFKPIILGPAEATRNPQFELLQSKKLNPDLEAELLHWLACS